jgi:hypothetical protein
MVVNMKSLLAAALLLATPSFSQIAGGPTLRALYVEDQRDRGVALADDGTSMLSKEQADKLPSYDWQKEVPKRDETRREQARTLLSQAGRSGEDYYYAAFIFQHDKKPTITSSPIFSRRNPWLSATVGPSGYQLRRLTGISSK